MHIRHLRVLSEGRRGQQSSRISDAVCHLLTWHIVSTHAQRTAFGTTRILRNMQTGMAAGICALMAAASSQPV